MNTIHPTAVIGDGVVLGTGNIIGPFVVLYGPLNVGDGNTIGPGAIIGTPPEVRGTDHPAQWSAASIGTGVRIGHRNVIREQVIITQGLHRSTVVGDDCFLMNNVHVPHDTVLENRVTLAPKVTMGGHVVVGAGATVGLSSVVHQRRIIGPGAMVGMGSVVTRDVPPFALVYGNPAELRGANVVGMSRLGVDEAALDLVQRAYAAGAALASDRAPRVLREHFEWWEQRTRVAVV